MKKPTAALAALIALSAACAGVGRAQPSSHRPVLAAVSFATPDVRRGGDVVVFGDSITVGIGINDQSAYGCTGSPGRCWADLLTAHYRGTTERNFGLGASCLEATTTKGSGCFRQAAGIDRYAHTILPYAGRNKNAFFILYGTNDVANYYLFGDTQINVATFKADYATVVAALEAKGTPGSQITLGEIPWQATPNYSGSLLFLFNSAIAEVAEAYHTNLASTYRSTGQCPTTCMTDPQHPNNKGHANLAAAFEAANSANAVSSQAVGYTIAGLTNAPLSAPAFYADGLSGNGTTPDYPGGFHGGNGSTALEIESQSTNGIDVDCVNDSTAGAHACVTFTRAAHASTLATLDDNGTMTAGALATNETAACEGGYAFGDGVKVYSFSGVPTCSAPAGSMYLRSDGTTGARLYISAGSGSWNAVAGV